MNIDQYNFPDDLLYDREHSWARVEGSVVTQGLTDFGQSLAGEIVYVEVPRKGREVKQGEPFMSMESGKWVGRIKAVVSGKIVAANEELEWESTQVNHDPYGAGWLVKIEMSDPSELDKLMKPQDPAFAEFIAAERAKYGK
ncbi:MAG: glycine cleavage system protein H [Anaerolineae bacterium]|nr:glycine cleavage system protein H [Anaerolineae bacterium]